MEENMKPKYLTFFLFVLSLILIITSQSVISIELMDNLYKDKTWLTLGDSITKSGIYQSNLSKKFKSEAIYATSDACVVKNPPNPPPYP